MALTLREYKGDGVRTLYPIDFDLGYLRKEYVKVYLKGDDPTNELTYSWPTENQIELNTAVSADDTLVIRRIVERNLTVNDYEDGAILHEENLDDSFKQALMILQEMEDGFISSDEVLDILTNINMHGNKILNLGMDENGSLDQATNKGYVDKVVNELQGGTVPQTTKAIGDGVVTTFTYPPTDPQATTDLMVFVDGSYVDPTTYTLDKVNGNIVFQTAPTGEVSIVGYRPKLTYIDGDFLAPVIRESKTVVTNGELEYTFNVSVRNASVFVTGSGVDDGQKFEGYNYTLVDDNTIRFMESYPIGTIILLGATTTQLDAQNQIDDNTQAITAAQQQADDNTLAISEVYTNAVQQTLTQWAAPNWSTYPWSVPDGSSVLLLGFGGQDTDLNTEVSDVFDRLSITQHPTSLKDVIKVVWRGQKVLHTIRLTMSITAGNNQFYRVELKRASDDSVVLRKVLSRNPDEAEQTVEMVTFTYKADDPYVTDGFYLEFVNDSGVQCEIDGSYSLTIFNHYQYLTPIT